MQKKNHIFKSKELLETKQMKTSYHMANPQLICPPRKSMFFPGVSKYNNNWSFSMSNIPHFLLKIGWLKISFKNA